MHGSHENFDVSKITYLPISNASARYPFRCTFLFSLKGNHKSSEFTSSKLTIDIDVDDRRQLSYCKRDWCKQIFVSMTIMHFYHTLYFHIMPCTQPLLALIKSYDVRTTDNEIIIISIRLYPMFCILIVFTCHHTHGRSVRFALCIHIVIYCCMKYNMISVCEILLQH